MTPEEEEQVQLAWRRQEEAEWDRRMEEQRQEDAIREEEQRQEEANNSRFGVGA
jgi:hypothetical protein